MSQLDLITNMPEKKEGDSNIEIGILAARLKEGELHKPIFQRDFIWPADKVKEWARTLETGKAIGCIVTYQIVGGGPIYLADGLQRLTATLRYQQDPRAYGFNYGPNQADKVCQAFAATTQHRIYANHAEAMIAFQNLNKGTSLTMAEFYKGSLCLDSDVGTYLWEAVPNVVASHIRPYASGRNPGRKRGASLLRDSLGLFLQYISNYKEQRFWHSQQQSFHTSGVEENLRQFIDENRWHISEAEQKVKIFDRYVADQLAEIEALVRETGQDKKPFSRSVLHWLLHLGIWRKNNGRPVELYREFVTEFLKLYLDFKVFSSRCVLENEKTGEKTNITTGMGTLSNLYALCNHFDVPLLNGRQRKQQVSPRPGYHTSHVEPVSLCGEGKTFIEPAPRNEARGARIVR